MIAAIVGFVAVWLTFCRRFARTAWFVFGLMQGLLGRRERVPAPLSGPVFAKIIRRLTETPGVVRAYRGRGHASGKLGENGDPDSNLASDLEPIPAEILRDKPQRSRIRSRSQAALLQRNKIRDARVPRV